MERIIERYDESAEAAGLRYVTDASAGWTRRRAGKGFIFYDATGMVIRDPDQIRRARSLVIPPAWTDVWICPRPDGHIQATGRDAKGRKQYRYHPKWREVRDENKYSRLISFGESLPVIRNHIETDLSRSGLPREKVLATVVQLLEKALIRIGNEEYARQNGSYGLTTLRSNHVRVAGSTLEFVFTGKAGKKHRIAVQDRRLARIVKRCQELPGQELFQYQDQEGEYQAVGSAEVNFYLREITGVDFSAKDFRTWAGSVHAMNALLVVGARSTEAKKKRAINEAIQMVAEQLGNTLAVCRSCYIHPEILEAYRDQSLFANGPSRYKSIRGLSREENAMLKLLKRRINVRERRKAA